MALTDINQARSAAYPAKPHLSEVAVFESVGSAKRAVAGLLAAGFTVGQITVVCSDHKKVALLREFEHQEPAGTHATEAALAGGAIGAVVGSLAVVASAIATGSVALWAAGPIFAWTGGVAGGLVGAMMTRGIEKEMANYYQQAVLDGDILVGAEVAEAGDAGKLAKATQVLAQCGAKPLVLPEG
ncbi:MAG TPA: general stress protein [Lacipirellulaceae bacterium]|jgi:hypothetical protein